MKMQAVGVLQKSGTWQVKFSYLNLDTDQCVFVESLKNDILQKVIFFPNLFK